ncbi:Parp12 [Symbiodinium sp. CCMP2592]|nr:Parp12 [Symbiodinium sp. CCMP2592]
MPSIRLLSLVQHSLQPGEKLKWIPWQLRLSSKQYSEIMEAKSSKPMRTEAQLLASAIYDDTPEMAVSHLRLSVSWLQRIQTVFRNAWALCGAAHLNNLKAFDKRVEHLALPDRADSSLKGPTTQELLAADRKIWNTISSLAASGWSLDEALYEVTSIRSDLANLLQPRPRPPPTPPGPNRRPNGGKGKGRGKGLQKPDSPSKSDSWPSNWVLKAKGKVLCKRYQRNLCALPNCKFAHLCAVRGCGKEHCAVDHDKKPS